MRIETLVKLAENNGYKVSREGNRIKIYKKRGISIVVWEDKTATRMDVPCHLANKIRTVKEMARILKVS